jgi:hypothetical protein
VRKTCALSTVISHDIVIAIFGDDVKKKTGSPARLVIIKIRLLWEYIACEQI